MDRPEFAYAQAEKSSGDRRYIKDVICYHCGEKGHYVRNCEKKNNEQFHMTVAYSSNDESEEVEHIFHQNITGILSNTWLLLDN